MMRLNAHEMSAVSIATNVENQMAKTRELRTRRCHIGPSVVVTNPQP